MKIIFIIHGRKRGVNQLLTRLHKTCGEAGLQQVWFLSTLRPKHAVELARQAVENGCDYLMAVGGDGTLNEVVNGMMQSKVPASAYPVLGLLPFGSGNDFARSAGLTAHPDRLLGLLKTRSIHRIDLGKVVLEPTGEIRFFVNIAGLGLGPEVVRGMEQASGRLGPQLTYFTHILKGFFSYTKKHVRCSSGTWQWEGPLLQMAVAKGRCFGNGLCIAPDARLADGQFQLALFGNLSLWDYLKNLGNLKKGQPVLHPQVTYLKAREVRVESPDGCGIEADGEYVGQAPAIFSILPGAIRFLMPQETPTSPRD